jgi:UDP-N-acetylglucosamine/UDP-N-acetylgalactosamine diphosphorylase
MHPIIDSFQKAGQGQVFSFFDQLTPEGQSRLIAEAAEIDLVEVERLNRTLVAKSAAVGVDLDGLAPAPYEPSAAARRETPQPGRKPSAPAKRLCGRGGWRSFTVAGGQGTRLGYDGPKGTFPVTPLIRGKPLFQVFAEKILAAGRRYGRPIALVHHDQPRRITPRRRRFSWSAATSASTPGRTSTSFARAACRR